MAASESLSDQFLGIQPALFDFQPSSGRYVASEAAFGGTAGGTHPANQTMMKYLWGKNRHL